MKETLTPLMRLLQFTDSAYPVGGFSFSGGLETAAEEGLVADAATLEAYVRDVVRQAAFTDGIAALQTLRSHRRGDYTAILDADRAALLCKPNEELRRMTLRMGKRAGELAVRLFDDPFAARWSAEIAEGRTPGCYPVAQGIAAAACALSEKSLFAAHLYGAANVVLNAALRCVRVSHYDTQRILFRIGAEAERLYAEAAPLGLHDMAAFVPQIDILAALHEKGAKRMFMN